MHVRLLWNNVLTVLISTLALVPTIAIGADFETEKGWNGHLFPSYIIATATAKLAEQDANAVEDDDDAEDDASPIILGDQKGLLDRDRQQRRKSDKPGIKRPLRNLSIQSS